MVNSSINTTIQTLGCRVVRKQRLAHDMMLLELAPPEGHALQYLAGQYIDVLMRDNRWRSFSLANAPRSDKLLTLHIRLAPHGNVSDDVFGHLSEGAQLQIRGPRGGLYLRRRSPRQVVFVTGGTGFAPIKAIIEAMPAEEFTRPVHLYRGARARRDLYMDDLAGVWSQQHPSFHYVSVLSDPQPQDDWSGRAGLVHQAVLDDFPSLAECDVYTSGPAAMVEAASKSFAERGLEPEHHFSDGFDTSSQTAADGV